VFEGVFQPLHLVVILGIAVLVFGFPKSWNLRELSRYEYSSLPSHLWSWELADLVSGCRMSKSDYNKGDAR